MAAGDWCWAAPLWANALLPNNHDPQDAAATAVTGEATEETNTADPDFAPGGGSDAAQRPGMEQRHVRLSTCRSLKTVGDAVRLGRLIEGTGANTPSPLPAAGSPAWQQWVITNLDPAAPTTFRRSTTLQCIRLLLQDISMEWRTAAGAVEERIRNGAAAPTETIEAVRAHIVSRLGWSRGPTIPPIRLHSLTVSQATAMLMRPIEMQRTALHADFAREAQQGGQATLPPSDSIDPNSMRAMQRRIWRTVRWERGQLEIMWRLPVDGVPLAGSSHLSSAPVEACGCGTFGGAHGASCSMLLS